MTLRLSPYVLAFTFSGAFWIACGLIPEFAAAVAIAAVLIGGVFLCLGIGEGGE